MSPQKRLAVYPGSFDPVTNGHLDLVVRATRLFDHVVVAVATDSPKTSFFSLADRRLFLTLALAPLIRQKRVSIDVFDGLLVRYAQKRGACALVRGLRAVSDFDYEFQMALMNRHQAPQLEMVYLMPDEKYTYLSSSLLKNMGRLGGRMDRFLPKVLIPLVKKQLTFTPP